MLRFRRYRVYLIFAAIATVILYHSSTVREWDALRSTGVGSFKQWSETISSSHEHEDINKPERPDIGEQREEAPDSGDAELQAIAISTPFANAVSTLTKEASEGTATHEAETEEIPIIGSQLEHSDGSKHSSVDTQSSNTTAVNDFDDSDESLEQLEDESQTGKSRFREFETGEKGPHDAPSDIDDLPTIHWSRLPEHFPIPTQSIIPLPTGLPKKIPTIQYAFKQESESAKADREEKQGIIKEAFLHTWTGYKNLAWMHDELKPVSGEYRDPFCHWAATLVDSLDTLWIMGLEEEFTDAVNAIRDIDFTTSPRKDIPIFETTIRYLGGLLSAHDLSGHKYGILLDKAVELADVLMGAFDTPNRMPVMYYYWRPTFAMNPHRSATRVVLAELGSLSVEFTRLAQLTKENKYYDAIARITNEFEAWQNHTKLPGLWPRSVDASGCKKPDFPDPWSLPQSEQSLNIQDTPIHQELGGMTVGETMPQDLADDDNESNALPAEVEDIEDDSESKPRVAEEIDQTQTQHQKRAVAVAQEDPSSESLTTTESTKITKDTVDCEPQGLASPPGNQNEIFTLGGQADSTYEYLPKQYMLLGGLVPQYKTMYQKAADAANKYLLYRPMIPDNRDVLMSGTAEVTDSTYVAQDQRYKLTPDHAHLTCFTGGMFGIAGKIFEREEDIEIAAKLTEGCVWSYEATATGIMPEEMKLIACEDRDACQWNETRWGEELDPFRELREQQRAQQKALFEGIGAGLDLATTSLEADPQNVPGLEANTSLEDTNDDVLEDGSERKELGAVEGEERPLSQDRTQDRVVKRQLAENESSDDVPTPTQPNSLNYPLTNSGINADLPTHEEYVLSRVQNENIPHGIPTVINKHYLLRPEAIESVFIMYRITGDQSWRKKGWKMFQAINKHARTNHGYSAIGDVNLEETWLKDEMESFWTAETLKYFYLLFSTEDTISLDEFVFNTEAHPLKRPPLT